MSNSNPPPPKPAPKDPREKGKTYSRFFTSKKGKVFDAWDYGYKVWPIGSRK
jgi:hypothetical protein